MEETQILLYILELLLEQNGIEQEQEKRKGIFKEKRKTTDFWVDINFEPRFGSTF